MGVACTRTLRSAYALNARYLSSSATRQAAGDVKTTTQDAPATPSTGSAITRKESAGESIPRHQPDYNATVDHGTS